MKPKFRIRLKNHICRQKFDNATCAHQNFQLLEYFLRNQEMVISKAQIAENIWEVEDENSSNLIEVYVNYLRKKVDKGFASKLIHTQFGRGYILKNE